MKCSTEKARGFYEKATEIIVNKATTIKAVGDENIGMTYYFHPEISKKYSEKGVFPMGEEKRNKLQKFLDTHQELGEPLSLGWINGPHFDTRTGQFWMTVKMPKATADAIDLADNMRLQYEYEEEAIKEAEKAYKFYRQITEDDFTLDEENELMSMAVTDNSDPLEEELSKMNFHEYRDNKVRLLEKIQEEYEMYRKTAKKGEEKKSNIKKYNQIISYLIKDIEQLKADEFNTVQKSVEDELVYLESIIDTLEVDSIEFNNVIDRLETLSNYFTGKTIRSKSLGEDYTSEFIKLADDRLRPEFINEVKARVGDLTKKYQDKEKDLVYKMILSNPSIKEHLDSGAMTYEDLEDLKLLIDTQEDINWLTQMMLGIHSGGGPLGQILGTYFESMTARERASTASKVKRLKEIVQLYKIDPKSFEKHIISDNGTRVPTGRLIHPYSNNYFKITGKIYELFRKFQGSDFKQRRTSYSKYMQARKNNQEVIDITKIRSFKEKYGNTPFGGEVFTSTEKEMIEYENQMKILMGEKIFNYILKEQEALVEDYVLSVKDAETEEKYIMSSPFYFAKHYNSPYYYLPVVNSINGKNYFPSSYYNVFVPKKEKKDLSSGKTVETDFYDKDFQKLFEEDSIKDKEKFEAWEIFTELLTGVNKTLQAQGISVSTLELPMVDAFIAKEFIKAKNISLGRKTGYITNSILDSWKKIYYNTSYLRNIENEDPNKIFISYRNTVKQSADKHYKILLSYSLDKIQQIAEKENLGYRDINNQLADIKSEDFKNQVIKSERERLAKMIAYKRSYNKASSDIFTTLEALVDITDVTRARVSTSIFANVVKGYVESKVEGMKIKTEDGKILKQHSNKKLAEFFDIWTKRNIYGNPLAAEKKEGKMFKIFSSGKNLQLFKYRNQQEKELNKILRETIKDLKNPDLEFEFKYEGLTYKRIKNKDGKMQSIKMSFDPINPEYEDITSEEFREVYEEHVKSAINKTGIPLTFGSLIQGSLQMQVLKSLLINLKSGFTNRHSGIIQNDLAAASGRLFDEAGLSQARTMLSFYNAQRYIKAIPGVKKLSFFYKERALQLETLDLLAKDYFKLLQDKKDQFARAEEYSKQKFSSIFSLMDFAVNNPENHNQLEVVLAVLARIEVYDNNGEKHFFVENNKFTIYEPGTLEVKENFRRGYRMIEDKDGNFIKDFVDNVRIWEEFSEEKGKKNTHLHVFNLISRAIDRTQGNYNDKDIAAVFSSTTGKTLMLFKRYLPEQINANFGTMDFDLATGLRKYEGRKAVLFRHAPTALMHLTFNAGISTGFIAALPLPMLISSAIGGSIILYNIFRFFKKTQKDSLTIDRNSLLVSLDYMQEVLLRSLNVPFRMITQGRNQKWKITVRGKEIPLNAIDLSKSISDKISPLSYEERRVLSESAQEIAERLKYMGLTLAIYLSLIALAKAADGDDDDDEAKIGILKKYEGFLNFIGNRFSMLSEEIEMYSSPFRFKDEMGQVMLLKKTDEIKSFANDTKDYFDFEGDSPSLNKFIKLPFVPLPLPNQLNDQLFKENTSFITDSRRYEKDWIENLIEKPETYIDDTIYQNRRKKFKEDIQKRARKQLKEKFPEWDNWQRVEEAKRISDALMRQGQEFGLKKVNKRGPAVYEEPVDFLERTSKYDIFTDEEVDREIEKRINGYRKRGKMVLGSKKYREKNKWE